jgi:histidinol-phosphate phosphatase family protein
VFLDRDGTLLLDKGYMHRPVDLRFLPRVKECLRKLQSEGFDLVLITNQSGVERGLITPEQLAGFHAAMEARLARAGVTLRGIYVCPHHPDTGCSCRKPGTALHARAIRELGLDPFASFAVGDRAHDVLAGHRIGARTVILRRRYLRRELDELTRSGVRVDHVAAGMPEAVRWILRTRNQERERGR